MFLYINEKKKKKVVIRFVSILIDLDYVNLDQNVVESIKELIDLDFVNLEQNVVESIE